MLRTALLTAVPCLVLAVATACSSTPVEEPHPGPPMSTGEVCVDVTPADADATIMLNGAEMTSRCQTTTTSYSASVSVIVTAPGYLAQTHEVGLVGGSETLTVTLVGPPAAE